MNYEYKVQECSNGLDWIDYGLYDLYEDAQRAVDRLEDNRYSKLDDGYMVKKESDIEKACQYIKYWTNVKFRIVRRPYTTDWEVV